MPLKSDYRAEYAAWINAKERCNNPDHPGFHRYGGRGIKMCDRWLQSFDAFFEDMGPRPSSEFSIDRINNNDGYFPSNCRWATLPEQHANRNRVGRFPKLYELGGEQRTAVEWAELLNTTPDAFKQKWRRSRKRTNLNNDS